MDYRDEYKEAKYFTNHKRTHVWKVQFNHYFPVIYVFYVGLRPDSFFKHKMEMADWKHDSAILSEEDGVAFLSDKIEISLEEVEHFINKKLMMKELIK